MRLHFGKASPLCKERDCERQFRHLYAAVFQAGQQQEEADSSNLLQYADAHRTCSPAEARDRSGFVDVQLHNADAAVAAALQCVRRGGLQVGSRRVPVTWAAATQPADTVRIVFMNPPLQFARQGFTRTVLAAAGYDDLEVVHEQLGFSRLVGDATMRVPCADSIVAYVRAADRDLILRQLPDAFECGDGRHVPTTIFVEGRSAQQPQKWQQEQQQRLRTKQRGRALQQERVLYAQQQEEHTSCIRQQVRPAWTQQQQQPQQPSSASEQQQQPQQETADAEMEDAPATAAQQQLQQTPEQVAAARVAEAFPGTLQRAGAAATLPCDPFAQQQGAAALQHAAAAGTAAAAPALAAYEKWRGEPQAEYLCLRAEDLAGADFGSADQETMLSAFYAQHGADQVSTAVVEQWLREYFPEAAAASYGEDDEQVDAADTAGGPGGAVADARGRDKQQDGADAAVGAAAAVAAAPLQTQRRSVRRRKEPDPVFAADVNMFAALATQQQHSRSQDTTAAAAAQPNTPPQCSRPRRGRAS